MSKPKQPHLEATPYTPDFYAWQRGGSARSAAVVVPLVLAAVPVRRLVDVGCGGGTWAAAFLANGVGEVIGIDGEYVDRSSLAIPAEDFLSRDLKLPIGLDRRFDLAVCLEVAEHLPESRAQGLVDDLVSLAPCVLFSAAVPGQGGTHHVNEQYLSYWKQLFVNRGYQSADYVRPLIAGNREVDWWYQQNIVLFAAPDHPLLSQGHPEAHDLIHRNLYEKTRREAYAPTVVELLRAFPGAISRFVKRRSQI